MSSPHQTAALCTAAQAMGERLRCPDCGACLVEARPASRPLKNRRGRSREALWKCPNGCQPAPSFVGWLPSAPEIQPTYPVAPPISADDIPF